MCAQIQGKRLSSQFQGRRHVYPVSGKQACVPNFRDISTCTQFQGRRRVYPASGMQACAPSFRDAGMCTQFQGRKDAGTSTQF